MKQEELDALIVKMLSEPDAYINDSGFTARVLGSLPHPGLSLRTRMAVLWTSAAAGIAACTFVTPAGDAVLKAFVVAAQSIAQLQTPPLWALAAVAMVAWGVFSLARFESESV